MASGETIYSAAYIMPSGKSEFGYERKHKNHLKIIESMIASGVEDELGRCKNLAGVFWLLRKYPCLGPFIAYQLAIDLNYSELIDFSENDFVEPGPGALDGIAKCFSELGDFAPADAIRDMTDIQERAFEDIAPIPHCRASSPSVVARIFLRSQQICTRCAPECRRAINRTRIKQLYQPSSRAHDVPCSPKWD